MSSFLQRAHLGVVLSLATLTVAWSDCGAPGPDTYVSSSGGTMGCTPGAQVACACPGGWPGAQRCADDGKRFEPCLGCGGGIATTSSASSGATGGGGGKGGSVGAGDGGIDGGDAGPCSGCAAALTDGGVACPGIAADDFQMLRACACGDAGACSAVCDQSLCQKLGATQASTDCAGNACTAAFTQCVNN